jgi:hypothetical protein
MTINLTTSDKKYKKLKSISGTSGKPLEKVLSDIIMSNSKKNTIKDPFYHIELLNFTKL